MGHARVGTTPLWVLTAFFAGWFGASVLCQFLPPRLEFWIRRFDVFSLLPRWKFFAPNVSTLEHQILYRHQLQNGELTPWKQVPLAGSRSLAGVLWNPDMRRRTTLTSVVSTLMRSLQSPEPRQVTATRPYLALVNFVTTRVPHPSLSRSVQFAIAESSGFTADTEPRIIFVSEQHPA